MAGFNYKDERMAEIYRGERMREAEVDRLARSASVGKGDRINLLNLMRAWLGKRLILLGLRLQNKQMSRDPL